MPVEGNLVEGQRWEFDEEVAAVFDDMLERSIPQYQTMRAAVVDLGTPFVRDDLSVVDLGCSRGEALAPFADAFRNRCHFVACEVSKPMREAAAARFRGRGVSVYDTDLRYGYPRLPAPACLTLLVLTLQFVPINYRQRILADAANATTDGGALILVEKVLGHGARIDQAQVDVYHHAKRLAGYTADEVERKRLALEGVLVPVTAAMNEQMLRDAGFREVDCFWRWMNFAGWVAVR